MENISYNKQPLVSIGIPIWNGELFISETLKSIVAQEYTNLEVIILDNISTDNTREICESFAAKDKRVKYILDDRKRDVVEAFKKIVKLVNGEYFIVVNDDDIYDKKFIRVLIPIILTNPKLGLVYSDWATIDQNGIIKNQSKTWLIKESEKKFVNFIRYLFRRTPLPISFGILKTSVHKDALKYNVRADNRGWNHDNLYMLRLLSNNLVSSVSDVMFFYRERDRNELYKKRNQLLYSKSWLKNTYDIILHQISVTKIIFKIINDSDFSSIEKILLRFITPISFLKYTLLIQILYPVYKLFKNLYQNTFKYVYKN